MRTAVLMRFVASVLALGGAVSADTASYAMHARVSYTDGSGMIKGAADAGWSYATANTIVLPGDTLWLDKQGAMEVELSGGTFLRLADGSKAEFASAPPSAAVRAWSGSFYIQRLARSSGGVVVETPAGVVAVDPDSHVRVDVTPAGGAVVSVRWGRATVRTQQGDAVTARESQRVYVDPGLLPSTPVAFDRNAEDSFDAWSNERARLLANGFDQVPQTVVTNTQPLGAADLAYYGEWVYVDNTQYWRPTVVVDYVPYRYGYWSYVPACGYVWVGDYPFSYVTSHYGRWTYRSGHGWLWCYTDTWGPAWVASVRYGPNFVWCPLDPYDRPVVIDTHFSVGGVNFGITASTWCAADTLFGGPCSVYPVTPTVIAPIYADNVYIWNIFVNGDGRGSRVPRPNYGSTVPVRDYSPRRVIRGVDTVVPGRPRADVRVAELEQSDGRGAFVPPSAQDRRSVRTAATPGERATEARSVRIDRTAMRATEQMRQGTSRTIRPEERSLPAVTANVEPGGSGRSVRGIDAGERGNAVVPPARGGGSESSTRSRIVRTPIPESAASGVTSGSRGSRSAVETPRGDSGAPAAGRGQDRAQAAPPSADAPAVTRSRTVAPAADGVTNRGAGNGSQPSVRRTPVPQQSAPPAAVPDVSRPSAPDTPSRQRSVAPTRPEAPMAPEAPSRQRSVTPSRPEPPAAPEAPSRQRSVAPTRPEAPMAPEAPSRQRSVTPSRPEPPAAPEAPSFRQSAPDRGRSMRLREISTPTPSQNVAPSTRWGALDNRSSGAPGTRGRSGSLEGNGNSSISAGRGRR